MAGGSGARSDGGQPGCELMALTPSRPSTRRPARPVTGMAPSNTPLTAAETIPAMFLAVTAVALPAKVKAPLICSPSDWPT